MQEIEERKRMEEEKRERELSKEVEELKKQREKEEDELKQRYIQRLGYIPSGLFKPKDSKSNV